MVIRKERPEEFSQIYDLVKAAFQIAKYNPSDDYTIKETENY